MWAVVVEVVSPCRHQIAGMAQVIEQMRVQAFVPHAAIEAVDEPVLHWLARRDIVPIDFAIFVPFQDGVTGQFRPIARREEAPQSGFGHARSPKERSG